MKTLILLGLFLPGLVPVRAVAGALYGTVRMAQGPAPRIRLLVACPRFAGGAAPPITAESETDDRGSYSVRVPTAGRCEMRAQSANHVGVPFEVFLSNDALRFDFQIDGAMNLVR